MSAPLDFFVPRDNPRSGSALVTAETSDERLVLGKVLEVWEGPEHIQGRWFIEEVNAAQTSAFVVRLWEGYKPPYDVVRSK